MNNLSITIPRKKNSVKYCDLDHAVCTYLDLQQQELERIQSEDTVGDQQMFVVVYAGKGDLGSAFRVLPLKRKSWCWLVMMAQNPVTGKWVFFVDKCLPFGSLISCAHFQRVSNAIKHLIQWRTASPITNYLDDFLFLVITIARCNYLVNQFLLVCKEINFPVSESKTEWAAEIIIFLGILLNGRFMTLGIPEDKRLRAVKLL